jgi:hypothetical protein
VQAPAAPPPRAPPRVPPANWSVPTLPVARKPGEEICLLCGFDLSLVSFCCLVLCRLVVFLKICDSFSQTPRPHQLAALHHVFPCASFHSITCARGSFPSISTHSEHSITSAGSAHRSAARLGRIHRRNGDRSAAQLRHLIRQPVIYLFHSICVYMSLNISGWFGQSHCTGR